MISSTTIQNAVYDLCVEANTALSDCVFEKILSAYQSETNADAKQALQLILKNAKMAYDTKKPLCQDTGQVMVFVKIGGGCRIENLTEAINNGVARAYQENFYRKSVVKNALFDRTNTATNTPCIIYSQIIEGDGLEIELLIKGAGAENMSQTAMLSPTSSQDEIVEFVKSVAQKAGPNACPPMFIGVGIGGTMDYAAVLSKKALLLDNDIDEDHKELAARIKFSVNNLEIGVAGLKGAFTALDVKVLTDFTHIASMPVAVTINCHSSRHAKCEISQLGVATHPANLIRDYVAEDEDFLDFLKIDSSDIEALKALKSGQKVLLSGEVYTARDMAHKRLVEMLTAHQNLPFELKDKIFFYAGPCPCKDTEIIGSVGPTTSSRMDKFAPTLYEAGLFATIGKGERSEALQRVVKQVGGLYFTVIGGIACYLSDKVVKKELIAFEDLGTEAIFKLTVRDFPLRVEF